MANKPPNKSQAKKTFVVEGKECTIYEPDFKQLSFGLSALNDATIGDLALAGKAVFDVCMVECDKEIKEDAKMLMSICIEIAKEYLLPYEVKIKKN